MRRLCKHSISSWLAGAIGLSTAIVFPSDAHAATGWTEDVYVQSITALSDGSISVMLEEADGDDFPPCSTVFPGNTYASATQASATGTERNISLLIAAQLARKPVRLYVTATAAGNIAPCTFARVSLRG
jgi:hypothetical protein